MLPTDFQFSQSNLQDFVDCPRRFQLRYLQQLKWPAAKADPVLAYEQHTRQGAIFHRLVQQHNLGVPADLLSQTVHDDDNNVLRQWWQNYLEYGLADLPVQRQSEIALATPLGNYRLIAKYDLLAIEPGQKAVIVDWKTSTRRPKRERLLAQLQTVVYRYVLVKAGAHLNGGEAIKPEQVTMVYWFANHPDNPAHFPYSTTEFTGDEQALLSLVKDIESRGEDDFDLTDDTRRCFFCTYRSLCERGEKAGNFLEMELEAEADGEDFDFDFDQIAEIAF